jgi:zinc protease
MRRKNGILTTAAAAGALAILLLGAAPSARAAAIAAHPRDLKYPGLKFDIPNADKYRFKLKNGMVAYIAEDHALPLVNVNVLVRVGSFLDPGGKVGLASMTGTLMRKGGAGGMTAEQFDERADFLAANISSSIGPTQGSAGLNCLSSALGPSLDLFFDMMKSPRFQQDRLDVEKGDRLEDMKQRNDDAGVIQRREWGWLLYGEDFFTVRQQTKAELDAITRDDMVEFHRRYWRPDGMILAISGDVDTKAILADLERRFKDWKPEGPAVSWPPQGPTYTAKPGLYQVEKDIPQGKVYIGQRSTDWKNNWNDPDEFALLVMNDILGGGGFTSRITKRIRSDEGLAYSAGSAYSIGVWWPLDWRISYQSKNATVALAAKISYEELKKIRDAQVTEDEVTVSKGSFIDTFPRYFDSPSQVANRFANDDLEGRPHAFWNSYRENIRKVTPKEIQRVARAYLQEDDKLIFLIVGKWSEIAPGDADKRASMEEFFGGKVTHLPLRDPLTLKPMP